VLADDHHLAAEVGRVEDPVDVRMPAHGTNVARCSAGSTR
jgi:hypothetical protein